MVILGELHSSSHYQRCGDIYIIRIVLAGLKEVRFSQRPEKWGVIHQIHQILLYQLQIQQSNVLRNQLNLSVRWAWKFSTQAFLFFFHLNYQENLTYPGTMICMTRHHLKPTHPGLRRCKILHNGNGIIYTWNGILGNCWT